MPRDTREGCPATSQRRYATVTRQVSGRPSGVAFPSLERSAERQRVLLARSLWGEPGLVLYDEPAAGLDLGAREDLLSRLTELARDPSTPPIVLVTHHVEEIPEGFTHALLVGEGTIAASGRLSDTLTGRALSRLFGLPLTLDHRSGRYTARRSS